MNFEYGLLSRCLHRLAFVSLKLQTSLADLEDRLFSIGSDAPQPDRPVFVTSLPRAGTTLLLELLYRTGEFHTHTYRQMPFVLSPLLWQRLSSAFQRPARLSERAHGDGMQVGYDSPEAFEEVLWMAFYAPRYAFDNLPVWSAKAHKRSFERFFKRHVQKLSLVSNSQSAVATRYLSKNNANIARLSLLPILFPDCRIVVPFRQPDAHIASLEHQHAQFLALHRQDRFARDYMRWIGHFDLGAALKPLNFDHWRDSPAAPKAGAATFWRAYWLAAYTHILAQAASNSNILLFDLERAGREPERSLQGLAASVGLRETESLVAHSGEIRAAGSMLESQDAEAADLYQQMRKAAIN